MKQEDSSGRHPYLDRNVPVDDRVSDLIFRMMIEEKVGQLSSQMIINPGDDIRRPVVGHMRTPAHFAHTPEVRKSASECAEIMNKDQKHAIENNRLGIPVLYNCESLHGAQWGDATCFPQAIALASSWNVELMGKVAKAIAGELRAVGVRQTFAPVINISRDSRWGRTQETYGEDTYLTSRMAVAYVKAIEEANVIATPKHFAANFADGGRDSNSVSTSWRTLREVYFPAFKACIQEGGARSIMPSYNSIDGLPCTCNKALLNELLRIEWEFKGFTVSDYSAVRGIEDKHKVACDYTEAVKMAMEAGLDVELPNGGRELLNLVKSGKLSEELINRSLERILRAKFELGLFEEPFADPQKADTIVRSKEHVALSLEAARESMVLLKNENILPLDRNLKTIGLFGQGKDVMNLGDYTGPYGGWCGPSISPVEGIRDVVSEQTQLLLHSDGEDPVELAKKCDAAIIFTEIFETEGGDRSDLDLPGSNEVELTQSNMNVVNVWERDMKLTDQQGLIRTVAATGVPTVVVLVNGAAVTMQNWITKVGAVLEAWYPGEQGGRAMAEVLFGDFNPGGKLPLTFPKTVGQLPLYYNFKPSGRGYAYSDNDGKPQFPFGHGLSYTQFTYNKLEVSVEKGLPEVMVTIRVEVENTGNCRGDEVVQVYINDEVSSVVTPLKELKGFKRIGLDIAEKSEVEFVLSNNELALWNMNMEFLVEPGTFKVMVGSSSEDIRIESSFELL